MPINKPVTGDLTEVIKKLNDADFNCPSCFGDRVSLQAHCPDCKGAAKNQNAILQTAQAIVDLDDWVSVSKRLPESDTVVLIKLNHAYRVSYYYSDSTGKHFSSADSVWDDYYSGYVTHWQPITPPKGA